MILNPEKISQHFNPSQSATICSKIASLGYDQEKTAAIQASTKIDGSNFELRYYCFPSLGDGNRTDVITAFFQNASGQYTQYILHYTTVAKSDHSMEHHLEFARTALIIAEQEVTPALLKQVQTFFSQSEPEAAGSAQTEEAPLSPYDKLLAEIPTVPLSAALGKSIQALGYAKHEKRVDFPEGQLDLLSTLMAQILPEGKIVISHIIEKNHQMTLRPSFVGTVPLSQVPVILSRLLDYIKSSHPERLTDFLGANLANCPAERIPLDNLSRYESIINDHLATRLEHENDCPAVLQYVIDHPKQFTNYKLLEQCIRTIGPENIEAAKLQKLLTLPLLYSTQKTIMDYVIATPSESNAALIKWISKNMSPLANEYLVIQDPQPLMHKSPAARAMKEPKPIPMHDLIAEYRDLFRVLLTFVTQPSASQRKKSKKWIHSADQTKELIAQLRTAELPWRTISPITSQTLSLLPEDDKFTLIKILATTVRPTQKDTFNFLTPSVITVAILQEQNTLLKNLMRLINSASPDTLQKIASLNLLGDLLVVAAVIKKGIGYVTSLASIGLITEGSYLKIRPMINEAINIYHETTHTSTVKLYDHQGDELLLYTAPQVVLPILLQWEAFKSCIYTPLDTGEYLTDTILREEQGLRPWAIEWSIGTSDYAFMSPKYFPHQSISAADQLCHIVFARANTNAAFQYSLWSLPGMMMHACIDPEGLSDEFYDSVVETMGLHHISAYMLPHPKSKPLYQSYFAMFSHILANYKVDTMTSISKGVSTRHSFNSLYKKLLLLMTGIEKERPQWFTKESGAAFDQTLETMVDVSNGNKIIVRDDTVNDITLWKNGGTWMNLSAIEFINLTNLICSSDATLQKKLQQLQGKMLNYMPFYPHFKDEAKSGCQIFIHKSACRLIEHQGVQAIYRYCQTLYDKSFLQFAVDVIIRSPVPADMLRLSVARWRQFDEPMAEAISKQASLSLSMSLPSETA